MGHRRFLPKGHRFRRKTIEFHGSIQIRTMRKQFDAFSRVASINVVLGKKIVLIKMPFGKKKSIFFNCLTGDIWMLDIV